MATSEKAVLGMESALLDACRRGDREAFRELFELHQDRVYSFALRFCGEPSRAADLTQDVFVKLFHRMNDYRGDAKFETWLYRVVANVCIDDQRKHRRFLPWLTDDHPSQVSGRTVPEDLAARGEAASAVHAAIAKLTPTLRAPVLLRYIEELSYEEIGEVLGLAPGTIASRLNRAHQTLAKKLDRFRGRTA